MPSIAIPLSPLSAFYRDGVHPPTPRVTVGSDMPRPYRDLLVNDGDMTPTLEAFHGCSMGLRVLDSALVGNVYSRQVVLLDRAGDAVEFGAIRIHLDVLPSAVQAEILAGRRPLGGLLIQHRVIHSSRPSAFFSVVSDRLINAALGLATSCELYGRCNTLIDAVDRPIAEVVEILPPVKRGPQP